jgi:hypothetical protein
MTARKRQIREPEEPVAATDPHVKPPLTPPAAPADTGGLAEYDVNGATYQLTADDAKRLGAKAIRPQNKAVTPDNK